MHSRRVSRSLKFSENHQAVENSAPTKRRPLAAPQHLSGFGPGRPCAKVVGGVTFDGGPFVDIALRFDMLAVLAVFAFVGAILLGAF